MDLGFDTYELKARIAPTAVILIPVFLALAICGTPTGFDLKDNILSGLAGVAIIYLFAQLIAYLGRRLQKHLFLHWGGAPSVSIMRWTDSTFSQEQKAQIGRSVEDVLAMRLPSPDDEAHNGTEADQRIDEVFKQVRGYLYEKESKGLWRQHLAEYGFARNLIAGWFTGGVISLACAGIMFYGWHNGKGISHLTGAITCMVWAALFALGRLTFLDSFTKHLAERYAQSAWTAFLQSARMGGGGGKQ